MFGSPRNRIPVSTWLRLSLTTAALTATALLSSGCIPITATVLVPVPAVPVV